MYESLIFTGGVHKSEEIKELIEDLGGFILQESIQQMELVLNLAVPIVSFKFSSSYRRC